MIRRTYSKEKLRTMGLNPSDDSDDVEREDEELRRYVLEHAYEIPLLVMEVDP